MLALDYATKFGLWLNLPRVWTRQAVLVARGRVNESKQALDWFDADKLFPEQAESARWEAIKAAERQKGHQ